MKLHFAVVEVPCPFCSESLTVETHPHNAGIESVTGCSHADALVEDEGFQAQVGRAIQEAFQDRLDRDEERWRDDGGEG